MKAITRNRTVLRGGAALASLAVAAAFSPSVAFAALDDGDVEVINTETVQVYMTPDGEIESKRVYEQLTMTGKGSITVDNPVETDGLRNLDGFGGITVEDGSQRGRFDVDGVERFRSVSDFGGDLPLEITIDYVLDGEHVSPGDIVGASGALDVLYTVKNVTSKPQEVSFTDGRGGTRTETVDVPVPIIGSLSTTLPASFTDVRSESANMAGDGKGGTRLSFTMTLVPPIGSDTTSFGYTAQIEDGIVPGASVSALPVNPLASPTFKTAASSYQSGSETGERLAAGATEIDSNLLKLRDGTGELILGLIKLSDGADQLSAGLSGEAVPGAGRLADGAVQLDDGLGRLADGAKKVADGSTTARDGSRRLSDGARQLEAGVGTLSTGAGSLDSGAAKLADGQAKLAAGLKQLYDAVDVMPSAVRTQLETNVNYLTLLGALQKIADGVGTAGDSPAVGTLLGGLNAVQYGMRFPGTTDCQVALGGGTPTQCGAMDGVDTIAGLLEATRVSDINATDGIDSIAELKAAINSIALVPACSVDPACVGTVSGVADGVGGKLDESLLKVRTALTGISTKVGQQLLAPGAGLDRLRAGLSNGDPTACAEAAATATPADDCGIKQAALAVKGGIPVLVDTLTAQIRASIIAALGQPTEGCDPTTTLRCAAGALADGGAQMADGMDQLVAGVAKLSAGGSALADGAGDLADGLGQLSGGAGQLSDGARDAHVGSTKIANGAGDLADGLGAAASGSGLLADGLAKAAGGAPAIEDGADRLSKEGMSLLIKAGEDTAQDYGKLNAIVAAGAERAQAESMANGAPEGALGLTAYTFEIKGQNGEGGRNVVRGVTAAVVLALGLGAIGLRRRFI